MCSTLDGFPEKSFQSNTVQKVVFLNIFFSFTNAIDKVQKPSKPQGNAQTSKQFGTESFFGIDIVTGILHTGWVLLQLGHEFSSY